MCFTLRIEIFFLISFVEKKNDKTLPIINKSKNPKKKKKKKQKKKKKKKKREIQRTKRKGPTSKKRIEPSKKANNKGRNIKFSNPPPLARSISNKEREGSFEMGGPLERRFSLEKPSTIAIACVKIETT